MCEDHDEYLDGCEFCFAWGSLRNDAGWILFKDLFDTEGFLRSEKMKTEKKLYDIGRPGFLGNG